MNDATPSAAERGDTVPRWVRWLVRVAAVAVRRQRGRGGVGPPRRPAGAGRRPSQQEAAAKAQEAEPDLLAHAGRERGCSTTRDARLRGSASPASRGRPPRAHRHARARRPAGAVHARGPAARRSRTPHVGLGGRADRAGRGAARRPAGVVAPGTTLRLRSTSERFTSLVSWGGSITLAGPRRPHWSSRPGTREADLGPRAERRPCLRARQDGACGSPTHGSASSASWSGRTGGLALTGSDRDDRDRRPRRRPTREHAPGPLPLRRGAGAGRPPARDRTAAARGRGHQPVPRRAVHRPHGAERRRGRGQRLERVVPRRAHRREAGRHRGRLRDRRERLPAGRRTQTRPATGSTTTPGCASTTSGRGATAPGGARVSSSTTSRSTTSPRPPTARRWSSAAPPRT